MARLSDSITYGNHAITGDATVGGTLTVNGILYQQIDLTGGSNVSISGSYPNYTISATDTNTTYSAGTGLSLSGTTFNVDSPFNASGTYASLRAQSTTKEDVGLSNIPNLSVTDNDTGNTIMQRSGSGDTWARLFRSSYSSTNATIDGIYTTQTIGGDYMRPSTPSQVKSSMGLGNVDDYSRSHYDGRYLAIGAKSDDSNQLDGLNSTQFVRSDTNDTMDGKLNININTSSPVYSSGHLELRTNDASDASMGFHRSGYTACQLRHENSGLILSGTSQTASANLVVTGSINSSSGTLGTNGTRDAFISTAEPTNTQGADGDVWYVYA